MNQNEETRQRPDHSHQMDPRHIVLDFTLLNDNCLPRNPTDNEFKILCELFPSQLGAGVIGPFLVITVKELPAKPWPVSVAGLPLFLTTNMCETPWEFGKTGNFRYH